MDFQQSILVSEKLPPKAQKLKREVDTWNNLVKNSRFSHSGTDRLPSFVIIISEFKLTPNRPLSSNDPKTLQLIEHLKQQHDEEISRRRIEGEKAWLEWNECKRKKHAELDKRLINQERSEPTSKSASKLPEIPRNNSKKHVKSEEDVLSRIKHKNCNILLVLSSDHFSQLHCFSGRCMGTLEAAKARTA